MRLALTGTPGTGKTQVARALARRGFPVVVLAEEALRAGAVVGRDKARGSLEVDVRALDRWVKRRFTAGPLPLILEGHLSHHLSVDQAVVLRCPPGVLARRLRARGWPAAKVRENACAEAVGVIVSEAVARLGARRVFEVNTSGQKASRGAKRVGDVAMGRGARDRAGRIDFLEEAPLWC